MVYHFGDIGLMTSSDIKQKLKEAGRADLLPAYENYIKYRDSEDRKFKRLLKRKGMLHWLL